MSKAWNLNEMIGMILSNWFPGIKEKIAGKNMMIFFLQCMIIAPRSKLPNIPDQVPFPGDSNC